MIGSVLVRTIGHSDAEAVYIAQTIVDHLPRIWGSEGDAEWFVSHSMRVRTTAGNEDDFGQRSNLGGRIYSGRSVGYDHRLFRCNQDVVLTLNGQLRDATFASALRDTAKCLDRLARSVTVVCGSVTVLGYFGESYTFCDDRWFRRWPEEQNSVEFGILREDRSAPIRMKRITQSRFFEERV